MSKSKTTYSNCSCKSGVDLVYTHPVPSNIPKQLDSSGSILQGSTLENEPESRLIAEMCRRLLEQKLSQEALDLIRAAFE